MNEHIVRTCKVRDESGAVDYEGLFHGFYERADTKDGHITRYARALVEDSFGVIRFVAPNRVEFTDGLARYMIDEAHDKQDPDYYDESD